MAIRYQYCSIYLLARLVGIGGFFVLCGLNVVVCDFGLVKCNGFVRCVLLDVISLWLVTKFFVCSIMAVLFCGF